MANFLQSLRRVFKNKNKPTAFPTTPSFKSYIEPEAFNASLSNSLQDQTCAFQSKNLDTNSLQKPIVKETKNMASQTDLSSLASEGFSSLTSNSSVSSIVPSLARTPPPPPPPPGLTDKKASDFQPMNVLNGSPLKHATQSIASLQSASIADELKFNPPTLKPVEVAPKLKPELTETQKKLQQIKKKLDES